MGGRGFGGTVRFTDNPNLVGFRMREGKSGKKKAFAVSKSDFGDIRVFEFFV